MDYDNDEKYKKYDTAFGQTLKHRLEQSQNIDIFEPANNKKKPKIKVVKDIEVKIDEEQLVEVDENKQPCTIVFIGHENAGKSTISG